MIYRAEWAAKMILGWICYRIFMVLPTSLRLTNRWVMWVLQWAGFYGCSMGFKHWMNFRKVKP